MLFQGYWQLTCGHKIHPWKWSGKSCLWSYKSVVRSVCPVFHQIALCEEFSIKLKIKPVFEPSGPLARLVLLSSFHSLKQLGFFYSPWKQCHTCSSPQGYPQHSVCWYPFYTPECREALWARNVSYSRTEHNEPSKNWHLDYLIHYKLSHMKINVIYCQ